MNNYHKKICYKNFRNKYAYQKALKVVKNISELLGNIDSFEKAKFLKKSIKISTEIALGEGNILTTNGKDFHFRKTLMYAIRLKREIEEKVDTGELISNELIDDTLDNLKQIIMLTRSYRKTLREPSLIENEGEQQ